MVIAWDHQLRSIAAGIALAGLLAACGSGSRAADDQVTGSRPVPTEIPAPTGSPVVTIDGAIGAPNVANALVLDRPGLASFRRVSGAVFEPWQKATLGYQGVRLMDLLAVAVPDTGAREIELLALDDYLVRLPIDDIDESVVVAIAHRDGSPIAVSDGGPARLVFTDDDRSIADPDNWIWSITKITVR